MTKHPINTFPRILYLNLWAIFLIFLAAFVALLPIYLYGGFAIAAQVVVVLLSLKGAITIINSWSDKKRKYTILMERNRAEFRPDLFTEYMQAPCGRLLVKVVLRDLGHPESYPMLKRYKKGFWNFRKDHCRTQKASIKIYPTHSDKR